MQQVGGRIRRMVVFVAALAVGIAGAAGAGDKWRDSFPVDKARLTDVGSNPYFLLAAGRRAEYTHGRETLVVTVLAETRTVDGVRTRVVEERESANGALVEVSRNYFAVDPASGDVYYFGEDVEIYKGGKVVGREGSWLSGVDHARFGLFLPGKPALGDRFQQEIAPGLAMDRVEVTGLDETIKTPAGVFQHCLAVKETTPLESGVSQKWYAPGVGLVKDDEFALTRIGPP